MSDKKARESTLIDKSTFDDPNEILLAGSNEEADLLADWDRGELVDTVQKLDAECAKLEDALKMCEELAGALERVCKRNGISEAVRDNYCDCAMALESYRKWRGER